MTISSKKIEYSVGDTSHLGYLAVDDATCGSRPGIVIVHEWWGLNDYVIQRAHMLAECGFVALAIDMYGQGQVASNPEEAGNLMSSVLANMSQGTAAVRAGYQLLLDQNEVDASRTAAIGYCFGGGMALHMARIGLPLAAVASFHGSLNSFHHAEPGGIKPEILVCHGSADSMVTKNELDEFGQEMKTAGANCEVLLLDGAKHGFSNPAADLNAERYGLDLGYQVKADNESWAAMLELFERAFK